MLVGLYLQTLVVRGAGTLEIVLNVRVLRVRRQRLLHGGRAAEVIDEVRVRQTDPVHLRLPGGEGVRQLPLQRKVLRVELVDGVQVAGQVNDAVADPGGGKQDAEGQLALHVDAPLLAVRSEAVI